MKITKINAFNTNATVFTENGFIDIDYDFQDRNFFDDDEEAEQWLKDTLTERGIEYNQSECISILNILWNRYTK